MGTICAGQGIITLPNPEKLRIALSYKLDQGSPICVEPAESFYNFYHLHSQVVGVGPVSQVSVCSKIICNKQRAVKIISKLALPMHIIATNTLQNNFVKLKNLKSPRLVKFYQIFESKDSYYIVSEYLHQGNICEILDSCPLPEEKARIIIIQLLKALIDAESGGIQVITFHPENILFTNLTNFQIKLNIFRTHFCETEEKSPFVSPELKMGKSGIKSSSWSLGMVSFYLLINQQDIPNDFKDLLSDEASEFLQKLLEKDPEKRFTLQEASRLSWVKDFDY
jgi:serine/threonine protein kinase